ncbi:hypothetical protein ACQPZ2_41230 [Nocardia pseudovaccinii]|uniref:hypothetical protein n=1 Tax=Nocardia pseudovaccinii TaxID=189540 RepID=UPI003D8C5B8B
MLGRPAATSYPKPAGLRASGAQTSPKPESMDRGLGIMVLVNLIPKFVNLALMGLTGLYGQY